MVATAWQRSTRPGEACFLQPVGNPRGFASFYGPERGRLTRFFSQETKPRARCPTSNSEQGWATAQPSADIAIAEPCVTAAAHSVRAVIDLIFCAAVVGTNEVAIVIAAMVLKLARQQRHRGPTVGKLRDRRRILQLDPSVGCRTCCRHGDKQRRSPNQRSHHYLPLPALVEIRWHIL